MLEGKELEKQIGDAGTISLDITQDFKIVAEIALKKEVDLGDLLQKYVEKTPAKWDDAALDIFKKAIALIKK